MTDALAGAIADPGAYRTAVRKLVGRASRTTTSTTTTTTEIGVLRLDGVKVKAGRGYKIGGSTYVLASSVNGDGITARLRVTTDGSTATTSSTSFADLAVQTITSTGSGAGVLQRYYYPSADEILSILLTVVRTAGTGNVSINAVNSNIDLEVEEIGPDTGNVGVAL